MHWKIKKKTCVTCFIVIFALLQWSVTEPTISSRCACVICTILIPSRRVLNYKQCTLKALRVQNHARHKC